MILSTFTRNLLVIHICALTSYHKTERTSLLKFVKMILTTRFNDVMAKSHLHWSAIDMVKLLIDMQTGSLRTEHTKVM